MDWLIWSGTVVTLVGVVLLIVCVLMVKRARRDHPDDEAAIKARLQKVIAINMAALGLSGLGLAMVVAGILLG